MVEIRELEIMRSALPIIDAVPLAQDLCWPGDAGHDECARRDHAAAEAAIAATAGLSWEFYGWRATAEIFRGAIEEARTEAMVRYEHEWAELNPACAFETDDYTDLMIYRQCEKIALPGEEMRQAVFSAMGAWWERKAADWVASHSDDDDLDLADVPSEPPAVERS